MEPFKVLKRRRSIRKFQDRKIPREIIGKLLFAAFLAPTSYNRRSWHFIVVDDRGILRQLANSKLGASGLSTAPLAIVVAIDREKDDIWIEDEAIAARVDYYGGEFVADKLKDEFLARVEEIKNDTHRKGR